MVSVFLRARRALWLALAIAPASSLAGTSQVFFDGFEPPPGMPQLELLRVGSTGPVGAFSDVMLSWMSEGAVSCTASSDRPGFVSGWSGQLPLESAGQRIQLSAAGNFTFTAVCSNAVGIVQRSVSIEAVANPPGAPVVSLSVEDLSVTQSFSIRGGWSAFDAQQCEASESGPAPLGFSGSKGLSGTFWLSTSRPGAYAFTLACSNAHGTSIDTTHFRVEPLAGCSDPMIMPGGWTLEFRDFSSAFGAPDGSPQAVYPNSPFAVPVGAKRGGITAISIYSWADPYIPGRMLSWTSPVSPNPGQGYSYPQRASSMFFSISPCPGDVRPPNDAPGADPLLSSRCRGSGPTGTLNYSAILTSSSVCRVEADRDYYINVMAAYPDDGLTAGETTCADDALTRCHVDATHHGQ